LGERPRDALQLRRRRGVRSHGGRRQGRHQETDDGEPTWKSTDERATKGHGGFLSERSSGCRPPHRSFDEAQTIAWRAAEWQATKKLAPTSALRRRVGAPR